MVFEQCKSLAGYEKMYMHCQHKQRQTGKHTKSNKEDNNKNTGCPAQIIVTLLPPKTHDVVIRLKHTHNHQTDVADVIQISF